MKKAKMGFLALAAILGVTSAFTTKTNSKNASDNSKTYGVVGLTLGHSSYIVTLFAGQCLESQNTCSIKFTSSQVETVVSISQASNLVRGDYR